MDWFQRLTGFLETSYRQTVAKLEMRGEHLHSLVYGNSYGVGKLELISLRALAKRAQGAGRAGRLRASIVTGDVRELHQNSELTGSLFQVASQFNLLEMTGPEVTPEDGVTRYQHDRTQGPACAIAAGAATIYRNYFVPIGSFKGQTANRQIDALADLGTALSEALRRPVETLWCMRNGYALCTRDGLNAIARYLETVTAQDLNDLRGTLSIGLHWDVEVTDARREPRPHVSQAFCSALPMAYSSVPRELWQPFASLVLEAAYEATLWAAVLNAQRGSSNNVLLTSLGGGAFGNPETWISRAMQRALQRVSGFDLNVKLVSHGEAPLWMHELAEQHR